MRKEWGGIFKPSPPTGGFVGNWAENMQKQRQLRNIYQTKCISYLCHKIALGCILKPGIAEKKLIGVCVWAAAAGSAAAK